MERKLLLDGKECREELKLRLTENLQSKIAPATKAYGMKKAGPQTFVQEKNGLVSRIQFFGYFRGGGYEAMSGYLCPIYAIQYGTVAVDAAMVESIHRKFDDILTFLADGYARLECCVQFNSEYMKERPEMYNNPKDAMAVMYHNAQLFIRTKEIADKEKRQAAIQGTYEEVCQFMRYYHGLAKKTKRT